MSDAARTTAARQIVSALAGRYQREGYHRIDVPAAALLSVAGRADVEHALAALLDSGDLVPVGSSGIALHPSARIALLTRAVLAQWIDRVSRESGRTVSIYREAIADELGRLTSWAAGAALPEELALRAAELAGVLAVRDLDPAAMDVVARHGGSAHRRLAALAATAPGSCDGVGRLLDHLRHAVSTDHPAAR